MLKIALKSKPNSVCIVPEKRKELTTEGGLNLDNDYSKLKKIIYFLKKKGIRTSLFIEPKIQDIKKQKNWELIASNCIPVNFAIYLT